MAPPRRGTVEQLAQLWDLVNRQDVEILGRVPAGDEDTMTRTFPDP